MTTIQEEVTDRISFIDSMRGFAALSVLFTHVSKFVTDPLPDWFSRATNEGARGVQLFYIISAFTLFLSLQKSNYIGSTDQKYAYFLRRIFRILPLFYVVAIITFLIHKLIPFNFVYQNIDTSALSIFSSITFLNNFLPQYINGFVPVQWSVSVEMLFYMFVPFLFLRIKNLKTAIKYYLSTSLLSLIFVIIVAHINTSVDRLTWINQIYFPIYTSLIYQLPVFFLGFIFYFLLNEEKYLKYIYMLALWSFGLTATFAISQYYNIGKFDLSFISPRIQIISLFLVYILLRLSKSKNKYSE